MQTKSNRKIRKGGGEDLHGQGRLYASHPCGRNTRGKKKKKKKKRRIIRRDFSDTRIIGPGKIPLEC